MSINLFNSFLRFGGGTSFPNGLGSDADGTCTGVTYAQAGHFGAGTAFDFSSGDKIDLNNAIISGTGNYTMTGWFNFPSGASGVGCMFQRGFPQQTSGGSYQGTCLARHTGTLKTYGYPMNLNGTAVSASAWHFIVLVRSSGTVTLYIDGSSDTSVSDSTDNVASDGAYTATFSLGNAYTSVSPASNAGQSSSAFNAPDFVGLMSEISIWNVALSSGNISTLWNSGTGLTIQAYADSGANVDGCLAYYNFTETSGDLINRAIP